MIRTLLIIAGAATVLCIAALGSAAALGGADLRRHDWTWSTDGDGHWSWDRDEDGRAARVDPGPETTRTVPWTGGDTLTVELSADVTYVQGPAATVVVTGPQSMVERVRVEEGHLRMDDGPDRVTLSMSDGNLRGWSDSERLRITVTAPSVNRFDLEGSSDVTIRDYDQDTMVLDLSGSGDVVAAGRVRALELDITGSGDVDLASLATEDADVDIAGSGDARLAPTGTADISISGSGDVDLTTRPARLNSDTTGSGDVDELG